MITFTILLITLLALAIAIALFIITGGVGILLVFGDLIICVAIFWLLIRIFRGKR